MKWLLYLFARSRLGKLINCGDDGDPTAQLSTRHMRCWIAIVAAINQLTEAGTREQVEQPLHELLTRLVEFDSLKL
ncbi:MAG: hypothetical protein AAF671_03365 [Pseudomonadota bacterium]